MLSVGHSSKLPLCIVNIQDLLTDLWFDRITTTSGGKKNSSCALSECKNDHLALGEEVEIFFSSSSHGASAPLHLSL